MTLASGEHGLQTQIKHLYEYNGYLVERMNSGKIPQTDSRGKKRYIFLHTLGTPDLLCHKMLSNGTTHLIYLEVKMPGNKPTTIQQHRMEELEEHGAECQVVHTFEEAQQFIQK